MDEDFKLFIDEFGPPSEKREVPASSIDRYRGKLPGQLLAYWVEHGWSSYARGLFWTVNPYEYEGIIKEWLECSGIPNASSYNVIARSAFGDLYLWKNSASELIKIDSVYSRYSHDILDPTKGRIDLAVRVFFASVTYASNDLDGLFKKALQKLGPLKSDEMYGFVPALALGGPSDLEHLEKVKTIEHLTFLSQLTPLTDWGFPDI
ncbi:DUF1851 domain-containing protein [Pseudomonas sp. GD03842]|uniref:GAD-like domain-containing protein n=1 Tax=unclassified Pseudomonas TaxID=196821 RepID=UPI000D383D09|nr:MULTISPECIES: GAD-like domain-containing protein [unclassified Pseudomonas]MDH0746587.1 DUF1851 domain-containing protein [Pseudomonas sp. GD03842]RAU46403.1 DUF1851 domain-containing protein [Pseudomonas sp. RIT 409]RAU52586.1 DUF1851 domain-containing protein [Pseudomonas sp. RIT 412]